MASSLTMQSGELVRYEGRPPAQVGGRDFVGPSPADRFYRTSDGWLRVQAPGLAAIGEALGLPRERLNDAEAVEEALASCRWRGAVERLNGAGIPGRRRRASTTEVVADPAITAIELV